MPNGFEVIAMELVMHLNPDKAKVKIDTKSLDTKSLNKYLKRINALTRAFRKVQRYELFFSEFYPKTEEITPEEALDHHRQAYITDLMTLRDSIMSLINDLKKDIQTVATNKAEMRTFFEECVSVTFKHFDKVAKRRNLLVHGQESFLDENIEHAKLMKNLIQLAKILPEQVDQSHNGIYQKAAEASFQKGKDEQCRIAKNNNEEIGKIINALFISLEDPLYRYLQIRPIIRDQIKKRAK